MAIQVGGTTVINNSKQLVGITGADSTTANALVAAGVGGDPTFSVPVPDFTSPDATFTSSGTWSKGSLGDNDLVWLYLVGGGNGGGHNNAGEGGGFAFVIAKAGTLNGSSYTIGAGGSAGNYGSSGNLGGTSSITVNGTTYTTSTSANSNYHVIDGALPSGLSSDYINIPYYSPNITDTGNSVSPYPGYTVNGPIFRGGSSPYVYSDGSVQNGGYGEQSLYAGNAGNSRPSHSSYSSIPTYGTGPTAGSVPGGGGGASYNYGGGAGAAGNMRQYNL